MDALWKLAGAVGPGDGRDGMLFCLEQVLCYVLSDLASRLYLFRWAILFAFSGKTYPDDGNSFDAVREALGLVFGVPGRHAG